MVRNLAALTEGQGNPMKAQALVTSLLLALALAGCSPKEPASPVPEAAAPVGTQPPGEDQPGAASPSAAATPAPGAHKNDPTVVNFAGFGPAHFGDDEEHVRMAWGYPLVGGQPAAGSTCYFLGMDPPPENGRGIRFMMEDGKFVRYDVDVPLHVAPGDIVVGDDVETVGKAHAGRIDEQPHKYIANGRTLTVAAPDGGTAKLVFEIDQSGKVGSWRIGVPPQVDYVEGCG
jgi:hypothetical protein